MGKATYVIIKEKGRKSVEVFYNRYGRNLLAYALKNWKTDEDTAWVLIYKTLILLLKILTATLLKVRKNSALLYC